jgi:hypothetical protein
MSEIPLPSVLQIVVSLYGYFLPLMLYAAWSTLAFWDLGRRDGLSKGAAIGWVLVILLIPFLGALAYHVVGGSQVPRSVRAAVVGGGLGVFAIVLLVGSMIGGIS